MTAAFWTVIPCTDNAAAAGVKDALAFETNHLCVCSCRCVGRGSNMKHPLDSRKRYGASDSLDKEVGFTCGLTVGVIRQIKLKAILADATIKLFFIKFHKLKRKFAVMVFYIGINVCWSISVKLATIVEP